MAEAKSTTVSEVEYRDCPGHPGYRVGSDGSVWSNWERGRWNRRTADWKLRKPHRRKDGHLEITLKGKAIRFVHHLVLEAFVGPKPEGLECRHLDGDPANNRVRNLAWGTRLENAADSVRHGTSTRGERNPMVKLTTEQVREIRRASGSCREVAAAYDVTPSCVSSIRRGENWGHLSAVAGEYEHIETRHLPKINAEQAAAIRAEFATGRVSKCALGRKYGVSHTAIHYVITRRLWKNTA